MATSISTSGVYTTAPASRNKAAEAPAASPVSATVAQSLTSPNRAGLTPLPQGEAKTEYADTRMDGLRRWFKPDYVSAGDKARMTDKIRASAEKLRYSQSGGFENNRRLVGFSIEEARKLENFARGSKDSELLREATFIVDMLADSRPSLGADPIDPGQQRTIPTLHYPRNTQEGRCAAAVAARAHREGKRGDNLAREVIENCGAGTGPIN